MGWDPTKQTDPNNISGANNEYFTLRNGFDQSMAVESSLSGKIYFECRAVQKGYQIFIGIVSGWLLSPWYPGSHNAAGEINISVSGSGSLHNNGIYGGLVLPSFTTGDVIGFAVDIDSQKLWVSKNGAWYYGQDPVSGANELATFPAGKPVFPAVGADFNNSYPLSVVEILYTNVYTPPAGYTPLLTPLVQYRVQGTITETSPVTDWIVSAIDHFALPEPAVHTVETSGTSYIIENLTTDNPVFATLTPKIGKKWLANHYYAINSLIIFITVTGHAHLFRCTAAGNSGATEPVWDTAQPVVDNEVTWGFVATLPRPRIQGPLIPELMP